MLFRQNNQIVCGFVPQQLTTTGQTLGDYVSLKNYNHFTALVNLGANGTTGTTIVLKKATSTTGAGATDATFHYAYNLSAGSGDTWTEGTDGTSITVSTGGTDMYAIEVDGAELGNYDCVAVGITPNSTGGIYAECVYILSEPRYADGSMPTAITD